MSGICVGVTVLVRLFQQSEDDLVTNFSVNYMVSFSAAID